MEELVPDIPRLYTGIAEWAACMVYVLALKTRFNKWQTVALCAIALVLLVGVQLLAGILPLYMWIPGMAMAITAIFGCLICICKVNTLEAVFWTARAFVLAEFAASLEWQFNYFLVGKISFAGKQWFAHSLLAVIYTAVSLFAYILERRYLRSNQRLGIAQKDVLTAAGIALTIFLISNISFISRNTPLSGQAASEIFYIRTLVDLCGVILFYAQQEQRHWLHAKMELESMKNILSRQYDQYMLSKDNIEMLNRKYHDLKHQIASIRTEENPVKRNQYLEEMETGIKMYEAQNKTGNKVLDTILTGKNMYCVQNGINFTCVADGTLLDFMDAMDICSIAGNALDNAIESVSKLSEPEKKLIKVAIYQKEGLLAMRFENYIVDAPHFERGLPVTTKSNKSYHGYGIKSIKATAEKYNGSLSISAQNNWFSLCLMIPVPEERGAFAV